MSNEEKPVFEKVSSRVNPDELEQDILAYWDAEKVFEKSLEQNKDKPLFTFYDGPPYATGKPHYGHILQSAVKDTVLRYKTMRGYYVPRRVGWDTHGLPIENLVEKESGIKSKREIEDDIEGFNKKCRDMVYRYVDEFQSTLKRMGRWASYDNAYSTLDRDYMESEWWVFKQLWDDGLVYKDFKTTAYCIRCATPLSNFEVSMGYKDKGDLTVYVLLPIESSEEFLLVWTTTPWTLPGNVGVAINPELKYVTIEHEGRRIVVAEERVKALFGDEASMVKTWTPEELTQLRYKPLYATVPEEEKERAYRVVESDHVTAADGTGLVHMAPAFGEEDAEVGKSNNLPVVRTVDTLGNFTEAVEKWTGKNIFDSQKEIIKDLKERGLLFKQEFYTHSYPFCWRCDTPLIYYALDSWFVKVSAVKDRMLNINTEKIQWIPEHVKHGRFAKGIESAPDWAVSRNRFWSVPMPIWECKECEQRLAVGSVKELKELSGATDEQLADIHRPYVDRIIWSCTCGKGEMQRVEEVLDVWFDSGSMPYAQWHYPFENKEFVEQGFPADFIAESIEMTRAWFYVLHVLATALTGKDRGLGTDNPAYTNAIASGLIFAEDGQKLSKKLKNYPEIEPTLTTYGADALRFYLLTSASLGEPYRFSEKDLKQLQRNVYMTLWNTFSFFTTYASLHQWQPGQGASPTHMLDKWILARTAQLEQDVMEASDTYHIDTAGRLFIPFIDDLSNWYVRRSRARFQKAGEVTQEEAFATLYQVLVRTVKLLAPFMPFVSETIFRHLSEQNESVHLQALPDAISLTAEEKELLQTMKRVRALVSEGLALRALNNRKIRQPLQDLIIPGEKLTDELAAIIREEVNVKQVVFSDLPEEGEDYAVSAEDISLKVALKISLTPELEAEGVVRDLIRHGQMLRRKAGYALNDRISVVLHTDDESVRNMIESQRELLLNALQADKLMTEGDEDTGEDVEIKDSTVHLGVKK